MYYVREDHLWSSLYKIISTDNKENEFMIKDNLLHIIQFIFSMLSDCLSKFNNNIDEDNKEE